QPVVAARRPSSLGGGGRMTLPSLFRRTPFRLTLLFLALFAAAASAILAYVYFASAAEARAKAERDVSAETTVLTGIYRARGVVALNEALIDRTLRDSTYVYLLTDSRTGTNTGSLSVQPIAELEGDAEWITFPFTETDPAGRV